MCAKAVEKVTPLSAAAAGWILAGRLDEIPCPGARVIRTPAGDIALFRTLDDRVFALRDQCPHQGGPLSQGIVYGHKVACPLHNWNIELDSGTAVAPDEGRTACYPVRIEAGMVYLVLPR
ncbi:MAG: nitrite reductase small subunit NirD [Sulfuricaulis sp.]